MGGNVVPTERPLVQSCNIATVTASASVEPVVKPLRRKRAIVGFTSTIPVPNGLAEPSSTGGNSTLKNDQRILTKRETRFSVIRRKSLGSRTPEEKAAVKFYESARKKEARANLRWNVISSLYYSIFTAVYITYVFTSFAPNYNYYETNFFRHLLVQTSWSEETNHNLGDIHEKQDFLAWFTELYLESLLNLDAVSSNNARPLGPAVIRQVRGDAVEFFTEFYPERLRSRVQWELSEEYDVPFYGLNVTMEGYVYKSKDIVPTGSIEGVTETTYPPGGFYKTLRMDPDYLKLQSAEDRKRMINDLSQDMALRWVDSFTRAISCNLMVYNYDFDNLIYIHFLFEFPLSGGTYISYQILTIPKMTILSFILLGIVYLFISASVFLEVHRIRMERYYRKQTECARPGSQGSSNNKQNTTDGKPAVMKLSRTASFYSRIIEGQEGLTTAKGASKFWLGVDIAILLVLLVKLFFFAVASLPFGPRDGPSVSLFFTNFSSNVTWEDEYGHVKNDYVAAALQTDPFYSEEVFNRLSYIEILRITVGFGCILVMTKLLNQFERIIPILGVPFDAFAKAGGEISGFIVVLVFFLCSVALCCLVMFQGTSLPFRDFGSSTLYLLRILSGDFSSMDNFNFTWHRNLGPIIISLFTLVMVYMILTMFIAIITDGYEESKLTFRPSLRDHLRAFDQHALIGWVGKRMQQGTEEERDSRREKQKIYQMTSLYGHTGSITCLASMGKGRVVISAGTDQEIRVWDTLEQRELTVLRGHRGRIKSLLITPDGRQLISSGEDSAVRLWDLQAVLLDAGFLEGEILPDFGQCEPTAENNEEFQTCETSVNGKHTTYSRSIRTENDVSVSVANDSIPSTSKSIAATATEEMSEHPSQCSPETDSNTKSILDSLEEIKLALDTVLQRAIKSENRLGRLEETVSTIFEQKRVQTLPLGFEQNGRPSAHQTLPDKIGSSRLDSDPSIVNHSSQVHPVTKRSHKRPLSAKEGPSRSITSLSPRGAPGAVHSLTPLTKVRSVSEKSPGDIVKSPSLSNVYVKRRIPPDS